jgi:hypothetical protein
VNDLQPSFRSRPAYVATTAAVIIVALALLWLSSSASATIIVAKIDCHQADAQLLRSDRALQSPKAAVDLPQPSSKLMVGLSFRSDGWRRKSHGELAGL